MRQRTRNRKTREERRARRNGQKTAAQTQTVTLPAGLSKPILAVDIETYAIPDRSPLIETLPILGLAVHGDGMSKAIAWEDTSPDELTALFSQHTLVFHNAKFDVRVLRGHGVEIKPGTYHDTMVMAFAHDPTADSYSLRNCAERYTNERKLFTPDETWSAWTDEMATYCLQDTVATLALYERVNLLLQQDALAYRHYALIELPFIECIMEMERNGFFIDRAKLSRLYDEMGQEIDDLRKYLAAIVPPQPGETKVYSRGAERLNGKMTRNRKGIWVWFDGDAVDPTNVTHSYARGGVRRYDHCIVNEFNPNSGIMVGAVLSRLGYEPDEEDGFTDAGNIKTDAGTLKLVEDTAQDGSDLKVFVSALMRYKVLYKIRNTFLESFKDKLNPEDGYLRGSFNQTVARTGRLSSSNPNLQNIPGRGEFGSIVRSLFIAPPGYKMVASDLSNIEGRVLAHLLSRYIDDLSMVDIFTSGRDFHSMNTINWGFAPGYTYEQIVEKVDKTAKTARNTAKTALYAVLYGSGDKTLGGGDKARGKEIRAKLNENAPNLEKLKELFWERGASNRGLLHTEFGRRLPYVHLVASVCRKEAGDLANEGEHPKQAARRLNGRAKRQSFNAILQGTAADVLKIIILKTIPVLRKYGAYLCAQIHDEIQCYCPEENAEALARELGELFSMPLLSHCPISGDPVMGDSWADTH